MDLPDFAVIPGGGAFRCLAIGGRVAWSRQAGIVSLSSSQASDSDSEQPA
jgi:hypothetical protein